MAGPAPDLGSYLIVKHSTWKGKYKRILSIGAEGITTYNPSSLEVTNQWLYKHIINISPTLRNTAQNQVANEFQLSMYKRNKVDHMRFSSDHRTDIITKVLGHRAAFAQPLVDNLRCTGHKLSGQDGSKRSSVILLVTPRGVEQISTGAAGGGGSAGVTVAHYHYADIAALVPIQQMPGGVAIKCVGFGRLHIFCVDRRDEFMTKAEDNCKKYIGQPLPLAKLSITLAMALQARMGRFSEDIHQTSLCEFSVQKLVLTARHPHCTTLATVDTGVTSYSSSNANYFGVVTEGTTLMRRILCITESCLVERDPASYGLVTLRPLSDIYALVRCSQNPQRLEVDWSTGGTRIYTCADRDALLASLMDGARGSGHLGVHVRMLSSDPLKRLGPSSIPVEEEVESMCLRNLQAQPPGLTFAEAIERFNANVPYSGLLHSVSADGLFAENKERLITGCLGVIVMRGEESFQGPPPSMGSFNSSPSSPTPTTPAIPPSASLTFTTTTSSTTTTTTAAATTTSSSTTATALTSSSITQQQTTTTSSSSSSPCTTPTTGVAAASGPAAAGASSTTTAASSSSSSSCSSSSTSCSGSTVAPSAPSVSSLSASELQGQFHALRRLVASKAGFAALTALPGFREKVGVKVVRGLQRKDAGVTHAAVDFLCALLQPMHDLPDLKQEQLNKTSLLHSNKFQEKLMDTFIMHVKMGTGGLVIAAMLDFLTFSVCAPYSETTDGAHFDNLLQLLASNGRVLYQLFQHPSLAIVKGAGLVLKAIIEEGEGSIPGKMQQLSLTEGALPSHLYTALYTRQSSDGRLLAQRQLSRQLVALWTAGNQPAMELLSRIVPRGLLSSLDSLETVPVEVDHLNPRDNLALAAAMELEASRQGSTVVKAVGKAYKTTAKKVEQLVEKHMDKLESVEKTLQSGTKHIEKYYEQYLERHLDFAVQHWKTRIKKEKTTEEKFRERPLVLRKRREHTRSLSNWPLFYYSFARDHALPNLIWNHGTREELRVALEKELREFAEGKDVRTSSAVAVSWNHAEFEVQYPSLSDEIRIGDYYLRVLLEQDGHANMEDSPIRKSYEFFNDLYHRFLLTPKTSMKCLCLQAMALVYGLHHAEIGQFNDTKYMVTMLARSTDRLERDRLLLFLNKLILERGNVREVLEGGGVLVLTGLMNLAHLHVGRATVAAATSNVIEAAPDMAEETAAAHKEWYYQDSGKNRAGPYSFKELKQLYDDGIVSHKTLVWAQGMDGWKTLAQVPQLKWALVATGQAALTESEMASLCLSMLVTMCRYFPSRTEDNCIIRPLARVKKYLSDVQCMPSLVQLLLTFDPALVEKVATLLCEVLQDNPSLSTVYTTGLFFFILMYMGSNVLPVARLLHMSHLHQSFRPEEQLSGGDLMQQSILGALLPEAMVCYLHNYGPEKFAEIFLGEFDTPEVIWNREMRRYMIQKIASHLADFSPRLLSNTRAQYQYCPIPHITYPQLDSELFCDIYYLKHLCDVNNFKEWPIKHPVSLLKKVLMAWRSEVEKQPSSMSVDEAYTELELPTGVRHKDEAVRHAYLKLAQKYHPDKNPQGRARFESVKRAYEFMCSRSAHRAISGPDPNNILLMISTQCILFHRYKQVLAPYKYAGYPMLLKTIQMESSDDQLFSKETSLLSASAELCYYTISCCAINAEELCRERGLQILQDSYSRCLSVLSGELSSRLAVEVCINTSKCYTAAAGFPNCRNTILEMMPVFANNLCYTLYFKDERSLSMAGVECCAALAEDSMLQLSLLKAGVLWHLLPRLFEYDYTLHESGVCSQGATNTQEVINDISIAALRACGRLAGLYQETPPPQDSPANSAPCNSEQPAPTQEAPANGEAALSLGAGLQDCDVTPENHVITQALQAMLTPYIVSQIPVKSPQEVLKCLTSNVESPYLVWDNGTRAQLLDFLNTNCRDQVKNGESDSSFGADFLFDAHKGVLVIGGVFIRVYNEQPMFSIENPKQFCQDLLQFIGSKCQYLHSLLSMPSCSTSASFPTSAPNLKLAEVAQALQALHNVCIANPGRSTRPVTAGTAAAVADEDEDDIIPGVELQCVGHFRLLLSLLGLSSADTAAAAADADSSDTVAVQRAVLHLLSVVAASADCVADIAASQVMVYLLLALHSTQLQEQLPLSLSILQALVSSTSVVKEMMKKGGVLYLLHIFCCEDAMPPVREKAAELLGSLSSDRLLGQRVRLLLVNLLNLPVSLVDHFRDGPATALHLYQSTQETPDLIWTESSRDRLRSAVGGLLTRLYNQQRKDPNVDLIIPESAFSGVNNTGGATATTSPFGVMIGTEEASSRQGTEFMPVTSRGAELRIGGGVTQEADLLMGGASQGAELVIGGVYVRLLQANPAWTLRKPKLFVSELFDAVLSMCAAAAAASDDTTYNKDDLELVTNTVVSVLSTQRGLLDYLPSMGHLPRVVELLNSRNTAVNSRNSAVVKTALLTVHQCSFSAACCSVLEAVATIPALMAAMQGRPDLVAVAVEALHNLFTSRANTEPSSALYQQAIQHGLVQQLLQLLQQQLRVSNIAATKAQIVACIKTIAASQLYGHKVTPLLQECPVWREYADQKHDLFLDDTPIQGYLTAGTATAGYLTQGHRSSAPSASSNPLPPELP